MKGYYNLSNTKSELVFLEFLKPTKMPLSPGIL